MRVSHTVCCKQYVTLHNKTTKWNIPFFKHGKNATSASENLFDFALTFFALRVPAIRPRSSVASYLYALVSVRDESYEKAKHHVDEERDERVKVDPAEKPHHGVLLLELGERREHVVPVHQGEEAFGHTAQTLKLSRVAQIHADIQNIDCMNNYLHRIKKKQVIFIHQVLKLGNSKFSQSKCKCCHLMVKRLRYTQSKHLEVLCTLVNLLTFSALFFTFSW